MSSVDTDRDANRLNADRFNYINESSFNENIRKKC